MEESVGTTALTGGQLVPTARDLVERARANEQDFAANNRTDTFRRGTGEGIQSGSFATGQLEGPGGVPITEPGPLNNALREAIDKAATTPNQPSTLGATNGFVARAVAKGQAL